MLTGFIGLVDNVRDGLRRWFVLHACILEHVRPFSAFTGVAVLEVLTKVVCPEELLVMITLGELVNVGQMFVSSFPITREI